MHQAQGVELLALVGLSYTLNNEKRWAQADEIMAQLSNYGEVQHKRGDFVEALNQLVKREVLETTKENPFCYSFQIEVLRLWVKHTQSISTILEPGI